MGRTGVDRSSLMPRPGTTRPERCRDISWLADSVKAGCESGAGPRKWGGIAAGRLTPHPYGRCGTDGTPQSTDCMHRTHSDHPVTDAREPLTLPLTAQARADGLAVFLDVAGTQLEIAGAPDAVLADPQLLDILDRRHRRLGDAVALISRRRTAGP